MDELAEPKLAKWPFIMGDVMLAGLAVWFLLTAGPLSLWPMVVVAACLFAGAWVSLTPFLLEYRAAVKLCESKLLNSTVAQIQKLEQVGSQIGNATAQWMAAHELAEKTAQTAREIAERMSVESKAFMQFLEKADQTEKNHLRLEVEKLHRAEDEWLKVITAILDHVHALYQAAVRSGQPGLIEQLGNFQMACRDVVRRVGLVPFEVDSDVSFDPNVHQLVNAETKPPAQSSISRTIATGYTYQGQLLRRALVELQPLTPIPQAPRQPKVAISELSSNSSTDEQKLGKS
jgi:molecular chaperone GrpE (heat shock protein)